MRLKYAEDFYVRSLLNKVTLKEVMTSPTISIDVKAPFSQVAKHFQQYRIRHLPVTNQKKEVVGIISQRDLYKIQPPHKNIDGQWVFDYEVLDDIILGNVMTTEPFIMNQNCTLAQALDPMVRNKYGCVPVINDEKQLCGILTQFDILKIGFQILQEGK